MAANRKNFVKGIGITPNTISTNSVQGDVEVLSTNTKLNYHNGTSNSPFVTEAHASQGANRLTNKDLDTTTVAIVDSTDTTKKINFDTSANTTAITTTFKSTSTAATILTLPSATTTLVGTDATQTLTNKTIDGSLNTITNIPDSALPADVVTLTGTQTLTNKTLTSPVIATITNGAATLTLPTTTDTMVGRATTDTLTNKTLTSPVLNTSTVDSIGGISGAQVSFTNGLVIPATKTLTLSNNSQTVSLQASPTASATYTITVPAAAPLANTALSFDGTNYVWGAAGGYTMNTALTLGSNGTISKSLTQGQQVWEVSSAGGTVILSTTPFGSSAPNNGVVLRLIGRSDVNRITITNNDISKGCLLKGNCTLGAGDAIEVQYLSSIDRYVEISRN